MSGELKLLCDLTGHKERVWSVAWSPSGKLLASCGGDKEVRIWAKDSQERWQCTAILEDAHDRTIRALAWSPGEDRIATASFDGTCVVWMRREGEYEQVATLQGHENEVKSVAFDPSGKLLATCSRDKSVWVWEAMQDEDDYECVGVLHGHSQDVKMVAWHPTKEVLVSASYDDTLRVWVADEDDWESVQTLDTHSSTVWALSFDASGDRMCSVSDDLSLRVWRDTSTSAVSASYVEEAVVRDCHTRPVYSCHWHPALPLIATGGGDDALRVFGGAAASAVEKNWSEGVVVAAHAHRGDVNCVRWQPTGQGADGSAVLATAGDDGLVRLWSFAAAGQ